MKPPDNVQSHAAPPPPPGTTRPPLALTLFVTWFGTGLAPRAPGTFGSLGALPLAALLAWAAGPAWAGLALVAAAAVLFLAGWAASAAYIRYVQAKDPGQIVIDEVAGQLLTLAVAPLDPVAYGVGFLLFRLADITKPFPVGWADRRVAGGLGIMIDDILAAVYSAGGLWIVVTYVI